MIKSKEAVSRRREAAMAWPQVAVKFFSHAICGLPSFSLQRFDLSVAKRFSRRLIGNRLSLFELSQ
jgi:hypothetical protein